MKTDVTSKELQSAAKKGKFSATYKKRYKELRQGLTLMKSDARNVAKTIADLEVKGRNVDERKFSDAWASCFGYDPDRFWAMVDYELVCDAELYDCERYARCAAYRAVGIMVF